MVSRLARGFRTTTVRDFDALVAVLASRRQANSVVAGSVGRHGGAMASEKLRLHCIEPPAAAGNDVCRRTGCSRLKTGGVADGVDTYDGGLIFDHCCPGPGMIGRV